MALVCPDCQTRPLTASTACPTCGRSLGDREVTGRPSLESSPRSRRRGAQSDTGERCPRCGSAEYRSLPAAYELLRGSGRALARQIAPPVQRPIPNRAERMAVALLVGCVIFLLLVPVAIGPTSATVAFVVGATSLVGCLMTTHERVSEDRAAATVWNTEEWPRLQEIWTRSYLCASCGPVPPSPSRSGARGRLRLLPDVPPGSTAA